MPTNPEVSADICITLNGSERVISHGSTVEALVRDMGLEGKRIAVERNGEIVPKGRYAETAVASSDRLEIVAAVGGG